MAVNPVETAITSIILKSDENSEFDLEVFKSNKFCQFDRLEMEESVITVFPKGVLVLRDKSDMMTYIAAKQIKTILVSFKNGEKFLWYITSLNYVNNSASEIDQTFIGVYFTNSIYHQTQVTSFYDEKTFEINPETEELEESGSIPLWPFSYPFMTTSEHIIKTYGNRAVFDKPLFPILNQDGDDTNLKGCGVNLFVQNTQEPVNYILFRPRIADAERVEQVQSNIVTFLNYIFTYTINEDQKPYYLFWTDFSNCLNYKFFDLKKDLASGKYGFDKPNTDPGKIEAYAVYNSDDIGRSFKIEDEDIQCKKVYVMITNPSHTVMDKNYYYIRSSPIYLEQPSHLPSGSTSDVERLMSPYLSESANTTLTTVTKYNIYDSPGLTYSLRTFGAKSYKDQNLINLPDQGYWGYAKDFNTHSVNVNITDAVGSYENILNYIESTPLNLRDSYFKDQKPLYPFNDNRYIWQFQYDITRTHPNIIKESKNNENGQTTVKIIEKDFYKDLREVLDAPAAPPDESDISSDLLSSILNQVTFNKVMKAKYTAMEEKNFYDNHRRVLLEQTEKENFVTNVLCCIGKDIINKEDWFFAQITGFVKDNRQIWGITGACGNSQAVILKSLDNAWLYSWKRLEPGPVIAGLTFGLTGSTGAMIEYNASLHNMFHGWTASSCYGSTGGLTGQSGPNSNILQPLVDGKGFTGINTWAINLNERFNCFSGNTNLQNYLGPGVHKFNLAGFNFRYKPIGFTGESYNDEPSGTALQVVKMFKISVNDLREMGALMPKDDYNGEYVYYFDKENAIDGAC